MNIYFVLSMSLMIVASLILLIASRSTIILLILLPASEFLGLLNPSLMSVKGSFDIHALTATLLAVAIIFSIKHLNDIPKAGLSRALLVLLALWLYGLIRPIFSGDSSPLLALEASKEFMMVFSYFSIYLFLRTEKDITRAWNYLIIFGLSFAIIELAVQFFGPALMNKMTYFFRPDMFGLWKIYMQFWPVIFIPLFYYYYLFALGLSYTPLRIALSGAGLILTFYRSYLLASIVSIPLVLLLSKQGINRAVVKSAILILVAGSISLILMASFGPKGILQDAGDAFILSGVREILGEGASGSLQGREVYAKQLREIVPQRPYFGFGFINREAEIVPLLKMEGFAGRVLGFIDKGNLDVLIKFGYIGGLILYGTFAYIFINLIVAVRKHPPSLFSARLLTGATTILVFFFVQPVHAPFTYSFSLLPLGIMLGLLDRERFLIDEKNKEQ